MVLNIFDFVETPVHEIMTPRVDMCAIEAGTSLEETIKILSTRNAIPASPFTASPLTTLSAFFRPAISWNGTRNAATRSSIRRPRDASLLRAL